jgi:hypothetical protein
MEASPLLHVQVISDSEGEEDSEHHQSENESDDDDDDHDFVPSAPRKTSEGRGKFTGSFRNKDDTAWAASFLFDSNSSSDDEGPSVEKRKETSSPHSPMSLQSQSRRRKTGTDPRRKQKTKTTAASFHSGSDLPANNKHGDGKINWSVNNTAPLEWDFNMEMGMGTGVDMGMEMDMGIGKETSTDTRSSPIEAPWKWLVGAVQSVITNLRGGFNSIAAFLQQGAHSKINTMKEKMQLFLSTP